MDCNRRYFLKVLAAGVGVGTLGGIGFLRERQAQLLRNVVRQSRPLLGTVITMTVHHPELDAAERAIGEAFAAIEQVDRTMSIHKTESQISQVNAAAGRDMVAVDPSIVSVLQTAAQAHAWTDGAYDVTCLPIMRLYGFYRRLAPSPLPLAPDFHFPSDRAVRDALAAVGQKNIVIDARAGTVGLTRHGAAIDLGSIGKGFAADAAGAALRKVGIERALIDVGGNLLAIGAPEGEDGWRVAIRNPYGNVDSPYFETLMLRDRAVATSGNYEQSVVLDGRRVGHLFDAVRGRPADTGVSATVVADNATLADALSTSAFLLGSTAATRLQGIVRAVYFHGYQI